MISVCRLYFDVFALIVSVSIVVLCFADSVISFTFINQPRYSRIDYNGAATINSDGSFISENSHYQRNYCCDTKLEKHLEHRSTSLQLLATKTATTTTTMVENLGSTTFDNNHDTTLHNKHDKSQKADYTVNENNDDESIQVDVVDANNDDDNNDDSETFNWDDITDAEALLACRSYLQKRQRLGPWQLDAERRQSRTLALAKMSQNITEVVGVEGFFWSNIHELPYLYQQGKNNNKNSNNLNNDDDNSNDTSNDTSNDKNWVDSVDLPDEDLEDNYIVNNYGTVYNDKEYDDDDDDNHSTLLSSASSNSFAVFDSTPPESFVKFSLASKRRWSDPDFRSRWYERRWGNNANNNNNKAKNIATKRRSLEQRIHSVNVPDLLAHPALANLTDAQVADAVKTYVVGNQKRSASRRAKLLKHTTHLRHSNESKQEILNMIMIDDTLNNPHETLPKDALLQNTLQEWISNKDQRSAKAKKAYQTRLSKHESSKTTKKSLYFIKTNNESVAHNADSSPTNALKRIEVDLDANFIPSTHDIKLICQPNRLGRRKQVLQRVLVECFGMRGKCVPARFLDHDAATEMVTATTNDPEMLLFMTACPYEALGRFIVNLIENKSD